MTRVADGVKVIELVPKRPDIGDERFHYAWAVQHTRVSRRVAPMRRYVQHHRIIDGLAGLPALGVPGITEAWFESLDAANSGFVDPVFVSEGLPFMRCFMDVDASTWMFATEEVTVERVPEGDPSARVILALRAPAGATPEGFQAALRAQAATAAALPGLTRLAQFFPLSGLQAAPGGYDAFQLMAFADLAVIEELWPGPAVQRELLPGLAACADLGRSGVLVAHALQIKPDPWGTRAAGTP